ncbi:MAG: hypothetical protein ABIT01_02130 [Thermoanaerobaculia bacterium]
MVLNRAFPVRLFLLAPAALALALGGPARGDIAPSGGVVRLSRAEYDKLKDSAEAALLAPPRRKTAEAPPDVESASYELRVEVDRITLDITADVNVKALATDARLTLPAAGLLDALADKGPGPVAALIDAGKKGQTTLLFRNPGRYRITARFVLCDRRDADRRSVEFTALPAASARLSASSLLPGAEFLLAPESGSPDEPLPSGAVRPIAASAFVRVTVKTPARIPAAAENAVVVAEVLDVVRIERERITVRTVVKLAVSRAEIRTFAILLPEGSDVLSVFGPDEPQFDFDRASGRVTLKFARPWLGDKVVSVLSFRSAPKEGAPISVSPARLSEATSSRSFLIVAPTPLRTPAAISLEGVARMDVADLPAFSRPFTTGASRAYRVVSATAARLVLSAPLRDVINPPDTLITDATLLTVFGDGKSRTDRRRYTIETRRAFFNAPLDAEEEILSVSVDENPVKPQTDAGSLVVLLPPSRSNRRTIDITTKRKGVSVPESGDLTIAHGALPGTASLASWTIVLPEQRKYRFVSSAGIRKVGWSQDAPAESRRYQPVGTNWLGDGERGSTTLAVKESSSSIGEKQFQIPRGRRAGKDNKKTDMPAVPAPEPEPAKAAELRDEDDGVLGGVEGGVAEGIVGGVMGGAGSTDLNNTFIVDGLSQQQNRAGIRSLAMDVTGHGKRLTLSGPLVGSGSLTVTLKVKKG